MQLVVGIKHKNLKKKPKSSFKENLKAYFRKHASPPLWRQTPPFLDGNGDAISLKQPSQMRVSLFGIYHRATPPCWHGIFSHVNKFHGVLVVRGRRRKLLYCTRIGLFRGD